MNAGIGRSGDSTERLIEMLNEDLAREYQSINAYVVYSQVAAVEHLLDAPVTLGVSSKQVSVEMPAGICDDSGQSETFSSGLWNGNQMVLSTVETHDASEL